MLKRSIICSIVLVLLLVPVLSAAAGPDGAAVVGTAPSILVSSGKQNGLYEECTLGDALADAMVRYTEADIAVVSAGCLKGNILPGDVTEADITDAVEDCEVTVVTIECRGLRDLLETCLSRVTADGKGGYDEAASESPLFPQISGFRLTYDPSAGPMDRVSRITIGEETETCEDSRILKVALPAALLEGEFEAYGSGAAATGETLVSLMKRYIADGLDDYYTPPKRIVPQGIRSGIFPNGYAVFMIVVIVAVVAGLMLPLWKKLRDLKTLKELKDQKEGETSDT